MTQPPSPNYPARSLRTHRITDLPPDTPATLAGRLVQLDQSLGTLADETGRITLHFSHQPNAGLNDIIEVDGTLDAEGFHVQNLRILAPAKRAGVPGPASSVKAHLRTRARILSGMRRYFEQAGFVEVETPLLVRCPGMEPHLTAFETQIENQPHYLPTSPEYAMKRLLCAGFERIYQICKAFRHEPAGRLHNPEFTILEWYRAYADYTTIMADAETLIAQLATSLYGQPVLPYKNHTVDLTPPWERLSVRDALRRHANIQTDPFTHLPQFIAEARAKGHTTVAPDDTADDAFFKVFLDGVEKHLGTPKPTFLIDYPAHMAALAKRRPEAPHLAERFEIYIAGIELANAFTELNDPTEQRQRLEAEQRQRTEARNPAYPIDQQFLAALEAGIPPSGGIALGVDRLVMLLTGAHAIQEVLTFPYPEL